MHFQAVPLGVKIPNVHFFARITTMWCLSFIVCDQNVLCASTQESYINLVCVFVCASYRLQLMDTVRVQHVHVILNNIYALHIRAFIKKVVWSPNKPTSYPCTEQPCRVRIRTNPTVWCASVCCEQPNPPCQCEHIAQLLLVNMRHECRALNLLSDCRIDRLELCAVKTDICGALTCYYYLFM